MRWFPECECDTARRREQQHRSDAAEVVPFPLNIDKARARSRFFERWEKKTEHVGPSKSDDRGIPVT